MSKARAVPTVVVEPDGDHVIIELRIAGKSGMVLVSAITEAGIMMIFIEDHGIAEFDGERIKYQR